MAACHRPIGMGVAMMGDAMMRGPHCAAQPSAGNQQ
jgi:hypothetical protein